jgi:hypothetical protein
MASRSPLAALVVALAAAVGCARSGPRAPAPSGDGHLTLVANGSARQLKLEGQNLFGPRTNVSFYADGYRGVGDRSQIVDLRPAGQNRIVGTVANQPTKLFFEEGPSWLQVRGLYKGRVSSFFVTPGRLQGLIGDCSYALRAVRGSPPGAYFGNSTCGSGRGGTGLTLFEGFAERPTRERVVALAILLGDE